MAEITATTIAENAAAPKRMSGDQGAAEQHSIPDQIAAADYAKKDDLLSSVQSTGRLPIMRAKVNPTWPS